MKRQVTIIDYGVGNLFSVARAFEHCGADVKLTHDASGIDQAELLVLPGVGAFEPGMTALREKNLVDAIKSHVSKGRPFLGICLGMQLMLETSEEFGSHEGLGIIPGTVKAIPSTGADGKSHKIPHIGWNRLTLPKSRKSWEGTVLQGLEVGSTVYFVHSYAVAPTSDEARVADCDYDGRLISAVVQSGAVVGCQFHLEKSGANGLKIVENLLKTL